MSTLNRGKFFSRQFILVSLTLFGGFWFAWNDKLSSELNILIGTVLAPYLASGAYQNVKRAEINKGVKEDGDSSAG